MKSMYKRQFAVLITLSFLLLLAACGKSVEDRWQEQYDLGQKYLMEMDYDQAIIAFTNAIEIDDKNVEAYLARAKAYTQNGDLDKALEDYNYIETNFPDEAIHVEDEVYAIHSLIYDNLVEEGKVGKALDYANANGLDNTSETEDLQSAARLLDLLPPMTAFDDLHSAMEYFVENEDAFMTACSPGASDLPKTYFDDQGQYMLQIFEVSLDKAYELLVLDNSIRSPAVMVYYGEHTDGVPNGNGLLLLGMLEGHPEGYIAKGSWSNGNPNGKFDTLYYYDKYDQTGELGYYEEKGTVIDGLWDGTIEIVSYNSAFGLDNWYPNAENGAWVPLSEVDPYGFATVYKYQENGQTMLVNWAVDHTVGLLGYADFLW